MIAAAASAPSAEDLPAGTFLSLGIDPGLRDTGIAAIERFPDGSYRSRGVKVVHTEPTKEKAFTSMRSSADDQRRIREHWNAITFAIQHLKPQVIGVENYLIFEPMDVTKLREAAAKIGGLFGNSESLPADDFDRFLQNPGVRAQLAAQIRELAVALRLNTHTGVGLGQAAKTIAIYGAALGACFSAGVPVFVFEPSDRTRLVRRGGPKVSKEEVGAFVEGRVHGLAGQIIEKVTQKTRREHAWDAAAHAMMAAEQYVQLKLDVGMG